MDPERPTAGQDRGGARFLWLAASLIGCERGKEADKARQAPAAPRPAVVVTEVLQKTVPIYAEFVAQTDARLTVEVRARVQGILKDLQFKEGDLVKKDQVLYQIEPEEFQANLEAANAQLAKATADREAARARLAKAQQDVARYRPLAAVLEPVAATLGLMLAIHGFRAGPHLHAGVPRRGRSPARRDARRRA